jgi:hypothetical protein
MCSGLEVFLKMCFRTDLLRWCQYDPPKMCRKCWFRQHRLFTNGFCHLISTKRFSLNRIVKSFVNCILKKEFPTALCSLVCLLQNIKTKDVARHQACGSPGSTNKRGVQMLAISLLSLVRSASLAQLNYRYCALFSRRLNCR